MTYHDRHEEMLGGDELSVLQNRKLRALLRELAGANEFWKERFGRFRFDPLHDALDGLPLLTRKEIEADQTAHPPYGTNLTYPLDRYRRLHQTSGSSGGSPIRWLDTQESWDWWKRCWGIIYRAAEVTASDRLFFPFSFGPFVGFWGAFEAAASLGNLCLPAGGMSTRARLDFLLDNQATVVCCTPTYATRMAEVAEQEGLELMTSPVRALIVAGEPGGHIAEVRRRVESAWGARVFDHAGMTEIGPWGFECAEDASGMHVMENEFIAEVIDPETGEAVAEGVVGELVLTNLGRWGGPLIRYRTGDQLSLIRRRCACGRWFAFAPGGILGRTDDMLLIRGNNVFPSAIEGVLRGIEEVVEFQVVIGERGSMSELSIAVEPLAGADAAVVTSRVADVIRNRFHFQASVRAVAPGALPRFDMKARRFVRCNDSR